MKKKGFTLIELLAVAVILGLMVLMVVPNLISTFNATKEKNKELFLEQLTEAAKVYAQNHKNDIEELRKEGGVIYITLEDLINEDLVTAPVIDPSNNKEVSPKTLLKIVRAANNLFEIEYNVIAPPILTISGVNPLEVIVGEEYEELGATAISPIDGDLTSNILISGTVNTSVAGTYIITYTVTDSLGNIVTKQRTVEVVSSVQTPYYLYNEGQENVAWTAYTISGSPQLTKTATTLEIIAFDGSQGAWATSSTIDLTNFSKLKAQLIMHPGNQSATYLVVSTIADGSLSIYDLRDQLDSPPDLEMEIDISGLTGRYYVRINLMALVGQASINKIWLE